MLEKIAVVMVSAVVAGTATLAHADVPCEPKRFLSVLGTSAVNGGERGKLVCTVTNTGQQDRHVEITMKNPQGAVVASGQRLIAPMKTVDLTKFVDYSGDLTVRCIVKELAIPNGDLCGEPPFVRFEPPPLIGNLSNITTTFGSGSQGAVALSELVEFEDMRNMRNLLQKCYGENYYQDQYCEGIDWEYVCECQD